MAPKQWDFSKLPQEILMFIKSWEPFCFRQVLHICDKDDEIYIMPLKIASRVPLLLITVLIMHSSQISWLKTIIANPYNLYWPHLYLPDVTSLHLMCSICIKGDKMYTPCLVTKLSKCTTVVKELILLVLISYVWTVSYCSAFINVGFNM